MIKKIFISFIVFILLLSSACAASPEISPSSGTETEIEEEIASQDETEYIDYYFKSAKLLKQHFEKHGIEMGFESAEDYEAAASDVINNSEALTKIEAEDGDYVFYIEDTNEFVILSTEGYIRTYFNPSAGKAYFDRQ